MKAGRKMRLIQKTEDNDETDNNEYYEDNDVDEKTPWMNDPSLEICAMCDTDYISGNWEQQS